MFRLLAAICLLMSGECQARRYEVADLLRTESYGQALIAQRIGLVLVERRARYDSAADYSYGYFVRRLLTRIMFADVRSAGRLRPLFEQDADAGYWMGELSPSGHLLTVFRLRRGRVDLGVVDLRTRGVRWFDVAPDLPIASPSPLWLTDDALLVVAMPTRRLPEILSGVRGVRDGLSAVWMRAAEGRSPSVTMATASSAVPDEARRSLVRVDVLAGTSRTYLVDNIVDAQASSDRRHVALIVAADFRRPGSQTMDTTFPGRRHGLVLLDMVDGAVKRIRGDFLPGLLSWSPSGKGLLLQGVPDDQTESRLMTVSAAGSVRILGGGLRPQTFFSQGARSVHAAWSGEGVVALMVPAAGPAWMRLDRGARRLAVPASASLVGSSPDSLWFRDGARLIRLGADDTARVTFDDLVSHGTEELDPASKGVRRLLHPSGAFPIVRSSEPSGVALVEDGVADVATDCPAGTILAATSGAALVVSTSEEGVSRLDLCTGATTRLLDVANVHLSGVAPPESLVLGDGPTTDRLFLPARAGVFPLVVVPYPGLTFDRSLPATWRPDLAGVPTNVQILTSHGYAVLLPSIPPRPPGSPGEGLALTVGAAVRRAVATGRVDGARMALLGHSFGAYAVMNLAAQTRRFEVAIASSGPYDLLGAHAMMTGSDRLDLARGLPFDSSAGWAEGGQARMGTSPQRSFQAYWSNSPIAHVGAIDASVMLVHGDMDIVGIDQAERMFMELVRAGRDPALVRYWGEGHVLDSPANIRDYWGRVLGFLDRHLAVRASTPAARPRSWPAQPTRDTPN